MHIGIITHHWVYNFGANLQALSSYSFLSKMGHDVWILNYRSQEKEDFYRQLVDTVQAETHERFCDLYLRQSPVCRSEKELVEFCRGMHFDAILVGSDAVFLLRRKLDREDGRWPLPSFPNPYWLTWASSSLHPVPLIAALAASAMGTNYYTFSASIRRGISDAVRKMTYVSVRDRWTQLMLCAVSFGRCWPTLCPDPVVVLDDVFQIPNEYAREPAAKRGQYILLSTRKLSDKWIQEFVRVSHEYGLQVFSIPFPSQEVDAPVDRVISLPLSPLGWYAWLQHAAGFVGVRMHPVLCSMVNNVPFLSFDTYQTSHLRISSKTYDLCTRAGVRRLCLAHRQWRNLTPRKAFEMLRVEEQNHVKNYVVQAKRDFSQVISEILAHDP